MSLLGEIESVIDKTVGRLKSYMERDPRNFDESKKEIKKQKKKEQQVANEEKKAIERERAQEAAKAKRDRKVTKAYGKAPMKRIYAPPVKKHEEKKVELTDL